MLNLMVINSFLELSTVIKLEKKNKREHAER